MSAKIEEEKRRQKQKATSIRTRDPGAIFMPLPLLPLPSYSTNTYSVTERLKKCFNSTFKGRTTLDGKDGVSNPSFHERLNGQSQTT